MKIASLSKLAENMVSGVDKMRYVIFEMPQRWG